MKRHFQSDFKSIRQATTAARHAENIGKGEGGNLAVILCAAYLHGTGPDSARSILQKVGAGEQMILEICGILDTQENIPRDASLEAKIVHDALTIKQLQDDLKDSLISLDTAQQRLEQLFTKSATTIAAALMK
jgi:HD superfamily phosphodiesterase